MRSVSGRINDQHLTLHDRFVLVGRHLERANRKCSIELIELESIKQGIFGASVARADGPSYLPLATAGEHHQSIDPLCQAVRSPRRSERAVAKNGFGKIARKAAAGRPRPTHD